MLNWLRAVKIETAPCLTCRSCLFDKVRYGQLKQHMEGGGMGEETFLQICIPNVLLEAGGVVQLHS